MNVFFLQVIIDSAKIKDSLFRAMQASASAPKVSLWDLLEKGGILMIPLALLFVIAVYVFIERILYIKKASKIDENFMNVIRDNIVTGNVTAARSLAKNTNNPVARIIDKGIQRIGKPIDSIEKSMENVGKLEMYKMERNLNILSLIAGIAPMFGFLGTIFGMFQLFFKLASTGEFTIQSMADGIYTKLITSAVGLIIGLLAYIAYNYLNTQIDKTANKMEAASAEFVDILQEPTR
ncbi:MAG: MotA/TolQ/ExbB proton channel family protein [Bacteroidetes bacterium]|nr:MotA/TolQ/ExbB proton channel family protein [Bacteroidota bacterium]MBS1933787.1 MotA/TolQ/ExbB proton channel family protein [Bacteroidota bacterium]